MSNKIKSASILLVGGILVLMLASFIAPLWSARLPGNHYVAVHGWGLSHNLEQLEPYIVRDLTPLYQTALAWIYLIACLTSIGLFTFLSLKKGKLIFTLVPGVMGIIHIAYMLLAVFVMVQNRITTWGLPLRGDATIALMTPVNTDIRPGFYLALVASGLTLILSLILIFGLKQARASS